VTYDLKKKAMGEGEGERGGGKKLIFP